MKPNIKQIAFLLAIALRLSAWQGASLTFAESPNAFAGNWAMTMPNGSSGWLTIVENAGQFEGELWTVGSPKKLSDVALTGKELRFNRKCKVGEPEFEGGPPTGDSLDCRHIATLQNDVIRIAMTTTKEDGSTLSESMSGKRMPPLPAPPNLKSIRFGDPIELFNGRDLSGWKLSNPKQINGWKVVDGALVNDTPKLDFQPWSRYGNLRSDREFMDFKLSIDFKVPAGGNSGIYLRGVYEAQVVDRDSRMQGLQGVGAIFSRIAPSEQAGKAGDEWQHYDIILVDRHVTVVLNGVEVIDNQPLLGCTNGAFQADETIPGPIYLQGDHTAVSYRNIMLFPRMN